MAKSNMQVGAAGSLALAVRLGEDVHAIPIQLVEEVLPALPMEGVPQCPEFVQGVVFVRGHLIPVISAAERLGNKKPSAAAGAAYCLFADWRTAGGRRV